MNLYTLPKKNMLVLLSLIFWFLLPGLMSLSYAGEDGKAAKGRKMAQGKGDSTTRPGKEPDYKKYEHLTPELWREINKAIKEKAPPGPGKGTQTWPCESDWFDPNQCDWLYEGEYGCNNGGTGTMCVTENNACICKTLP